MVPGGVETDGATRQAVPGNGGDAAMTEAIGMFRPVGRPVAEGTAAPLEEPRLRALRADFEAALGEDQGAGLGAETPVAETEAAARIAQAFAIGALFREAFNREWGEEDGNGT